MDSPVPADHTNQLQITDLAEVLQLLRRHGYSGVSYYNLGLFLGLSPNTMHLIEADHRGDTGRCFSECLTKWLKKADKVQETKGGPTIYSLISALRELGENRVADGIDMEKHPACKILACYSAEQSILTALPQLVRVVYLAKLIKEMILPTNVQGEALLIQIKEAVCIDYEILEAFAEILRKIPATGEIGNTIMKEYREVYCSDDFVKANDDNGLKIFLPKNVTSQFQLMRLKMGQTFFKVGSIMMSNPQSPTLDNIKFILGTSDKALRPQVAQCQNVHSILQLVYDSCQLDDISLLEFFVDEFNIEEAKPVIEEYKKAIEELKKTKLSQCLNEMVSYPSPLECEIITIFVDKDVKEFILNDVKRLSSAVFKNLSQHVRLNVIRDSNSFSIICSFPLILSEQLITTALNNIDVLKDNKVKRLTIGYCTVYEVNDTSTVATMELNKHHYISSLSTSSGLMKQLMLSLSVQLINSEEEVTTLNEKNEELKDRKELLEQQLLLFQSEKKEKEFEKKKHIMKERSSDEIKQLEREKIKNQDEEIRLLNIQLASYQKTDKDEMKDKMKNVLLRQNKILQEQLLKLKEDMQQEKAKSKQEIELLKEKITTMNLQQIEREQVQEKEHMLTLKNRKIEKEQEKNPLIFEDESYGDIVIDNPLIMKIVKTRQFQRLKDIKKLGYTYHTIPKANYSRLQHSIGMYCLAGKYVKQLRKRQPELNITDSDVLCVQIAALCYNLGHGPFSHTFSLFLDKMFNYGDEKLSEASAMMFDHMIEENDEVKNLLEECLDNYEEDIAFIKELIHGIRTAQRKGKEFLYEIVVNRTSGLDVCIIDYTTRDAAALGMKISFKWKVFLSKVQVRSENGELHIFFQKDDLETYNDLFRTHHSLYKELYYVRKNRIAAAMIARILVKANETPIIRDRDRRVTISEATQSMLAYSQLNDSILDVVKSQIDDPEAQELLDCLETMKFIGQIGYVTSTVEWDKEKIKKHIVQNTKSCDIIDQLVLDPIKNGYENWESYKQYYYTSDGYTGQWTNEWVQPPLYATKAPIRVFLVSGDMNLIHEVQGVLWDLIQSVPLNGAIYPDEDNCDLMPHIPLQKTGEVL